MSSEDYYETKEFIEYMENRYLGMTEDELCQELSGGVLGLTFEQIKERRKKSCQISPLDGISYNEMEAHVFAYVQIEAIQNVTDEYFKELTDNIIFEMQMTTTEKLTNYADWFEHVINEEKNRRFEKSLATWYTSPLIFICV